MTPPVVSVARLHDVLIREYKMLPGKARAIRRHVYGDKSVVMVAYLVERMQAEPFHWTKTQAQDLGRRVQA